MCNWFDTCCGVNNVEATCLGAMNMPILEIKKQKNNLVFVNVLGDFIARLENREKLSGIIKLYSRFIMKNKVWAIYVPNDLSPFVYSFRFTFKQLVFRVFKKIRKKMRV